MRKDIQKVISDSYITQLFIFCIILFFALLSSHIVYAQENQLIIDVIDEVVEGDDFSISVYTLDEENFPEYQIDVDIIFNEQEFQITTDDENREISLIAPDVTEDTSFDIQAVKDGFVSAEITILVKNKPRLIIEPEQYTIDVGSHFSVFVTDENENPIASATVGIQSYTGEDAVEVTDEDGRAWLVAPEDKDRDKITLLAQKSGYLDGTQTIYLNSNPDIIQLILQHPFTPVFIAAILLFMAIIFVNARQKKSIYKRTKELSKEKTMKKYDSHGTVLTSVDDKQNLTEDIDEKVKIKSKNEPKVEEIRISRPRKEKDIVKVDSKKDNEKVDIDKIIKKQNYDWFEGKDDIRYEIDKITGEIDEEGLDKWFVGIDDVRVKIDNKVKKKDKKKQS